MDFDRSIAHCNELAGTAPIDDTLDEQSKEEIVESNKLLLQEFLKKFTTTKNFLSSFVTICAPENVLTADIELNVIVSL